MKTVVGGMLLAGACWNSAAADEIAPLSPEARAAMRGSSWSAGCPVSLDDLAAVEVRFIGFDGEEHGGTIVVHEQLAREVAAIFEQLRAAKFPIGTVAPWEQYGARVYAEKNVTTGFYCETAQDDPGEWSSHAYGYAIDVNPLLNPFHDPSSGWWPSPAAANAPRDDAPGKISPGSAAFAIFAAHGWAWGGFETGDVDYMHFIKVTYGSEAAYPDRPYAAESLEYRSTD
ncbi:M15 family metallopeptidase [Amaricoccus sp. W119]|uniref:M15 family metallopeptidase n=1 Tax=Amaricoccus sp. W119 TaxID=3391833 RepID=UPI0039A4E0BE